MLAMFQYRTNRLRTSLYQLLPVILNAESKHMTCIRFFTVRARDRSSSRVICNPAVRTLISQQQQCWAHLHIYQEILHVHTMKLRCCSSAIDVSSNKSNCHRPARCHQLLGPAKLNAGPPQAPSCRRDTGFGHFTFQSFPQQ